MMFLLDTHTFLWFITDNPLLSKNAQQQIENLANQRFLSIASLWEIAIKVTLKKLDLARPFNELIPQQLQKNYIEILPIAMPHLNTLIKLPFHHRDPFDRLIISQSLFENISIIGIDEKFDKHGINRIW